MDKYKAWQIVGELAQANMLTIENCDDFGDDFYDNFLLEVMQKQQDAYNVVDEHIHTP